MSLKEYDTAVQIIRQGLIIEPNNSQLMKQLRLAQQQKKVIAAKQQSAMVATSSSHQVPPTTSDGIALDPATAAEYQELQKQYTQLARDHNTIQADILKSQRESKVADITCTELSTDVSDSTSSKACFRSIGKLFIKTTTSDMINSLKERQITEEENVTTHTKKLQYMERQLNSIQQNMNEILQKAQ